MTYRPLDGVFLAAREEEKAGGQIAIKPAILLSSIAVLALTSTAVYSTSVTINADSSISYSQGTQIIAACDPDGISTDLDFAYNAQVGFFVLTNKFQKLTGIHEDCFSTVGGERKVLSVRFYEGTTLQLEVRGTMPVKSNNGQSLSSTNNTVIFAGANDTSQTNPFKVGTLNDTACDAVNPSASGTTAGSLLCGLGINLTTLSTTGNDGKSTIAWGSGCAVIPDQLFGSGTCLPIHVAYSSDRLVIEIE